MYVCDRCGRGIDWEPCIVRMESPYRSVGGRRDVGLERNEFLNCGSHCSCSN